MRRLATATYPGEIWELDDGRKLGGVHLEGECIAKNCVLHNPSDHSMSDYSLLWRVDRQMFERTCPHGVGHPDPDQVAYWKLTRADWEALTIHGCDGCCSPLHTGRGLISPEDRA